MVGKTAFSLRSQKPLTCPPRARVWLQLCLFLILTGMAEQAMRAPMASDVERVCLCPSVYGAIYTE